jgi:hypothetical protein
MLPVQELDPLMRVAVPKVVPALFITSTLTESTRSSEKNALAPDISAPLGKQDISNLTILGLDGDGAKSRPHAKRRQNENIERISKECLFIRLCLLVQIKIKAGIRVQNEQTEFYKLRGFVKTFAERQGIDVDRFQRFVSHRLPLYNLSDLLNMNSFDSRQINPIVIH